MPKFHCNKLGRDNGVENFRSQGITPYYRFLNYDELLSELKKKIAEESEEVKEAKSIEELTAELADILEVIDGLCKASGIPMEQVMLIKDQKRIERGGFEKGFYLEAVEMDENNPRIKHFRSAPDKYPEE